jgi:hypothetical protein
MKMNILIFVGAMSITPYLVHAMDQPDEKITLAVENKAARDHCSKCYTQDKKNYCTNQYCFYYKSFMERPVPAGVSPYLNTLVIVGFASLVFLPKYLVTEIFPLIGLMPPQL